MSMCVIVWITFDETVLTKVKKLLVADETANDPDEHNKTRHITMTRRRSSHKEHCKVEGTDAR